MLRPGAALVGGIPPRADSPISWVPAFTDDYGVTTLGYWGGFAVQIQTMIFNDRLLLSETGTYGNPIYGWCYPKGGAAHLAALAWNPETENEPAGYKKAVIPGRPAGERALWWHPPMA